VMTVRNTAWCVINVLVMDLLSTKKVPRCLTKQLKHSLLGNPSFFKGNFICTVLLKQWNFSKLFALSPFNWYCISIVKFRQYADFEAEYLPGYLSIVIIFSLDMPGNEPPKYWHDAEISLTTPSDRRLVCLPK